MIKLWCLVMINLHFDCANTFPSYSSPFFSLSYPSLLSKTFLLLVTSPGAWKPAFHPSIWQSPCHLELWLLPKVKATTSQLRSEQLLLVPHGVQLRMQRLYHILWEPSGLPSAWDTCEFIHLSLAPVWEGFTNPAQEALWLLQGGLFWISSKK